MIVSCSSRHRTRQYPTQRLILRQGFSNHSPFTLTHWNLSFPWLNSATNGSKIKNQRLQEFLPWVHSPLALPPTLPDTHTWASGLTDKLILVTSELKKTSLVGSHQGRLLCTSLLTNKGQTFPLHSAFIPTMAALNTWGLASSSVGHIKHYLGCRFHLSQLPNQSHSQNEDSWCQWYFLDM